MPAIVPDAMVLVWRVSDTASRHAHVRRDNAAGGSSRRPVEDADGSWPGAASVLGGGGGRALRSGSGRVAATVRAPGGGVCAGGAPAGRGGGLPPAAGDAGLPERRRRGAAG